MAMLVSGIESYSRKIVHKMRQYHWYLVLLCTRHSSYATFYFRLFSAVNSFSSSSNDDSKSDTELNI